MVFVYHILQHTHSVSIALSENLNDVQQIADEWLNGDNQLLEINRMKQWRLFKLFNDEVRKHFLRYVENGR